MQRQQTWIHQTRNTHALGYAGPSHLLLSCMLLLLLQDNAGKCLEVIEAVVAPASTPGITTTAGAVDATAQDTADEV
jgi:hypothetical protein